MRADRLIRLMMVLNQRGRLTAQALARELEVSRRTIYRDLDALTIAGVPVYSEGGPGGGIWLDENYRVSLTGLNEGELQSLFIARAAGPLAELGLGQAMDDALLKLFAALPSLHHQQIERFRAGIYLDPGGWWPGDETSATYLQTLQMAVFQQLEVQMLYERNNGERLRRCVQPYGLVAKADAWYLVAAHSTEGEEAWRTYRLSRIVALTLGEESFERAAGFDLRQYWHAHAADFIRGVEIVECTLRVRATRLQFLRLYLSGGMTIEPVEADAEWLRVTIRVGEPEAAVMIATGLGADAEILAPDSLRVQVTTHVQRLAMLYA